MQLKKFFVKDEGLLALTSGGSVDFTPPDFDGPLTEGQRRYLYKHCGMDIPQVFWRKQVHGDDILEATGPAASAKGQPDADAYITDKKNLPIAIRTADCVPVFIFDPKRRVIALAHAGWQGTHKEIAAKTVQRMQSKYGSQPADLKAVLGPSIRKCCYKVGKEFHEYFPSYVRHQDGFLYADMAAANRDQLVAAGVPPQHIFDSNLCTCCDSHYFSFRRDGEKAGRMISLMMLK